VAASAATPSLEAVLGIVNPGSYDGTLRLYDDGGMVSRPIAIQVDNAVPVVDAQPAGRVVAGRPFSRTISFADVGLGPWSYSIDWGDGSPVTIGSATGRSFAIGKTYPSSAIGARIVSIFVNDGSGDSQPQTFTVAVVANQAPVAVQSIPSLNVRRGVSSHYNHVDLRRVFVDADNASESLEFEVVNNTNDAMVMPTIDSDGTLDFAFDTRFVGTSTVRIRATDPYGASTSTDAVFTVSVTGSAMDIVVDAGVTVTDAVVRVGDYHLVKLGTGTLVLDKANSHTGGVTVEAGTIVLRNGAALGTGVVRVKAGAAIVIDPAAGHVIGGRLVVEPGGRMDIGTGRLTISTGMTVSRILDLLTTARGSGAWTSSAGLGSSAVAAAMRQGLPRTLGWRANEDGSFTVAYAAPGDTNLDNVVDVLDVANYLSSGNYGTDRFSTWMDGDANYDGLLDVTDVASILATGLFNSGAYQSEAVVSAAFTPLAAEAAGTSAAAAASPFELAFAAMATGEQTTTTTKKRIFASFR
jgi:autotransporter-associated beta strand protein